MSRNEEKLKKAITLINELQEEFWKDIKIPGQADEFNYELQKAVRVAESFDLGKLMCTDGLNRNESCGAHFREESQTEGGEAKRDDKNYAYVAAWEYQGEGKAPKLHKEDLVFENVELKVRDYK